MIKLYQKFIRPVRHYLGLDHSHRVEPIEAEAKWYPEDDWFCADGERAEG